MAGAEVLSVLIASDVHLGYAEKDPLRADDSFKAFEEVLALAKHRQVDMILLAGDLFHDNKPSRKTLMRCMQLLRDYCLGEREVQIEVVSDQTTNFHGKCAAHTCLITCRALSAKMLFHLRGGLTVAGADPSITRTLITTSKSQSSRFMATMTTQLVTEALQPLISCQLRTWCA